MDLSGPCSFLSFVHICASRPELRLVPRAVCLDPRSRNFFSSKKEEEAKTEEAAPEVSEAEAALQERIAELEEKNVEYFDKYRRSLADFENLRNRMNKQVADAKIFGIQGFCKVLGWIFFCTSVPAIQDLLDVADVLGKAISVVPKEALEDSQYLRDMHQGLQLTESQILKVPLESYSCSLLPGV